MMEDAHRPFSRPRRPSTSSRSLREGPGRGPEHHEDGSLPAPMSVLLAEEGEPDALYAKHAL